MFRTIFSKILFLYTAILALPEAYAAADSSRVFVFEIRDAIDPRATRHVEEALAAAKDYKADLIIIDMNTYGGAVDDADKIRTMLLKTETPLAVFINDNAASAGALISIACDSIYMTSAATIGAATVVTQDGAAAPDKYQSYMRKKMRATAEATGRNPEIAEGMVDEDIQVDSISEEGKVITFSTQEALQYGFCEAEVKSIEEVIARFQIENPEINRFKPSVVSKISSWFLNPAISGVLILIIIGGIYFELQSPGIGFPLIASIVAAVLYFIPYYLNNLAAEWEILLFLVGVALIAVEIFVIPGFGVAGIAGITLSLVALVLVMISNDFLDFTFVPVREVFNASVAALGGLLGGMAVLLWGGLSITRTRYFQKISLNTSQKSSDGYSSKFEEKDFTGMEGTAFTTLRPSGKVEINNELYDASTRGEYIEKNSKIVVIKGEGYYLTVRKKEE